MAGLEQVREGLSGEGTFKLGPECQGESRYFPEREMHGLSRKGEQSKVTLRSLTLASR